MGQILGKAFISYLVSRYVLRITFRNRPSMVGWEMIPKNKCRDCGAICTGDGRMVWFCKMAVDGINKGKSTLIDDNRSNRKAPRMPRPRESNDGQRRFLQRAPFHARFFMFETQWQRTSAKCFHVPTLNVDC
jgi:hypothetical protein